MLGIEPAELRFAYSLHIVEAVEEGSHQSLDLLKEDWQFLLHGVVEVLVVCTGSLELLLKLEKVLLILERLLLFVLELRKRVVEAVVIHELVFSLCNVLAHCFEDHLKIFEGCDDAGLDEVDLWGERLPQLVHHLLVVTDVAQGGCRLRVTAFNIVL